MGLFIANESRPLEDVENWSFAIAGAELNVALGLSRLSHDVSYVARLGNDIPAEKIKRLMLQNAINSDHIIQDLNHSTGIMFKGKVTSGDPPISYCRRGSAASFLSREDCSSLPLSGFSGGILHLTGITAGLSPNSPDVMEYLMGLASSKRMTVSFDPNLRSQLWESREKMVEVTNRLASFADIIFPGYKEGLILCGTDKPEKIAEFYLNQGARAVVVKVGAKGAYCATKEGGFFSPGYEVSRIVDTVGAGDGFAAGVLSAIAEDLSLEEAVDRGNAVGALQISHKGDNEGLPTREQLEKFMTNTKRTS